jgi:hypothetical protein
LLSQNIKVKINRTVILPVVVSGCEAWSLTLREEHRSQNMLPRKIFGPKRDEVTGDWSRLYNEELYDLCSSPNIIPVTKSRRKKWVRHVARMGDRRGAYSVLVGDT